MDRRIEWPLRAAQTRTSSRHGRLCHAREPVLSFVRRQLIGACGLLGAVASMIATYPLTALRPVSGPFQTGIETMPFVVPQRLPSRVYVFSAVPSWSSSFSGMAEAINPNASPTPIAMAPTSGSAAKIAPPPLTPTSPATSKNFFQPAASGDHDGRYPRLTYSTTQLYAAGQAPSPDANPDVVVPRRRPTSFGTFSTRRRARPRTTPHRPVTTSRPSPPC